MKGVSTKLQLIGAVILGLWTGINILAGSWLGAVLALISTLLCVPRLRNALPLGKSGPNTFTTICAVLVCSGASIVLVPARSSKSLPPQEKSVVQTRLASPGPSAVSSNDPPKFRYPTGVPKLQQCTTSVWIDGQHLTQTWLLDLEGYEKTNQIFLSDMSSVRNERVGYNVRQASESYLVADNAKGISIRYNISIKEITLNNDLDHGRTTTIRANGYCRG